MVYSLFHNLITPHNLVTAMQNLTRITRNPEVMGGKPCIGGMRVTVGTIVGLMASGHSLNDILNAIYNLFKSNTKTPPEVALLFFAGHFIKKKTKKWVRTSSGCIR